MSIHSVTLTGERTHVTITDPAALLSLGHSTGLLPIFRAGESVKVEASITNTDQGFVPPTFVYLHAPTSDRAFPGPLDWIRVLMYDDGTHGDVTPGDGIFTATWTVRNLGRNHIAVDVLKLALPAERNGRRLQFHDMGNPIRFLPQLPGVVREAVAASVHWVARCPAGERRRGFLLYSALMHSQETAEGGARWRSALLWGILALAAAALFTRAAIPGIAPASDLWDYSQESRQIARGEGFTSLYTYPVFLGHEVAPFPVLWRMPLYAALGALLLKLGIPLPGGFLYMGAVAHALLVAMTYWIGATLHSSRAGSWAAACAVSSPLLLDFYNPGMSQAPAAALGLAVWIILLCSRGALAAGAAALAAAAAWHLRGESLLFVPIWLWIAASPNLAVPAASAGAPRWTRAVAFGTVFAALCLPWLVIVHQARDGFAIQGNPMLLYTPQYPGYSSSRMLGAHLPGVIEYVLQHPGAFALRYMKDIAGYLLDLFAALGPLALGAGVAGIAVRRNGSVLRTRRNLAPLLAAIAWQILAMSALERSPRFLVPVFPLACVVLGIAAVPILARIERRGLMIAVLAAVVLERGANVTFQHGDASRRFPPVGPTAQSTLTERAREWPRGGMILSDAPDWAAWHLDRPALFLPLMNQLDSLSLARPVAAIWLSPAARQRNVSDADSAWVRTMDRNAAPAGFSGPEILPDGSRIYRPSPHAGKPIP